MGYDKSGQNRPQKINDLRLFVKFLTISASTRSIDVGEDGAISEGEVVRPDNAHAILEQTMKLPGISAFKAHAMKVIDSVASEQESVTITRYGKPLARVVPFRATGKHRTAGKLASAPAYEKDIISPPAEDVWEETRWKTQCRQTANPENITCLCGRRVV